MKTEFNKPDFIDSNKAFEQAIKKEILSDDETRPDFAGNLCICTRKKCNNSNFI